MTGRGARLPRWSLLLALLGAGVGCGAETPAETPPGETASPTPPCPQARLRTWVGDRDVGSSCSAFAGCLEVPDLRAQCVPSDASDRASSTMRCHRFARGQLGDPCTMTLTWAGWDRYVVDTSKETLPDVSTYCDLVDHLECDPAARRCVQAPTVGESCVRLEYCDHGSFCDPDTWTCVAARPRGAACDPTGDLFDKPQCVGSSRCEPGAGRCAPLVLEGGQCFVDTQCASGACAKNACTAPGDCPDREGISFGGA